jgi:hypothetical protein
MMPNIRGSRVFRVVASVASASLTVVVRPATAEGYPQARGGWFLGFAFGGAHASAQRGNITTTSTETGFGFTLGAAHDVRVRRTFSLGPQIDYSGMTLSGFDANDVNLGLSFDWHFLGT